MSANTQTKLAGLEFFELAASSQMPREPALHGVQLQVIPNARYAYICPCPEAAALPRNGCGQCRARGRTRTQLQLVQTPLNEVQMCCISSSPMSKIPRSFSPLEQVPKAEFDESVIKIRPLHCQPGPMGVCDSSEIEQARGERDRLQLTEPPASEDGCSCDHANQVDSGGPSQDEVLNLSQVCACPKTHDQHRKEFARRVDQVMVRSFLCCTRLERSVMVAQSTNIEGLDQLKKRCALSTAPGPQMSALCQPRHSR